MNKINPIKIYLEGKEYTIRIGVLSFSKYKERFKTEITQEMFNNDDLAGQLLIVMKLIYVSIKKLNMSFEEFHDLDELEDEIKRIFPELQREIYNAGGGDNASKKKSKKRAKNLA